MAEQSGSKDDKTSQEKSLISDTISEMIQNPVQVDIAKTLGLLDDDPSTLMATTLDTSSMQLELPTSTMNRPIASVSEAEVLPNSGLPVPTSLEELTSSMLQGVGAPSTIAGEEAPIITEADILSVGGLPISKSLEALTSNLLQGIISGSSAPSQVATSAEQQVGSAPPSVVAGLSTAQTQLKQKVPATTTSIPVSAPSPIPIPIVTKIQSIDTAPSVPISIGTPEAKKPETDDVQLASPSKVVPNTVPAAAPLQSHAPSTPSSQPSATPLSVQPQPHHQVRTATAAQASTVATQSASGLTTTVAGQATNAHATASSSATPQPSSSLSKISLDSSSQTLQNIVPGLSSRAQLETVSSSSSSAPLPLVVTSAPLPKSTAVKTASVATSTLSQSVQPQKQATATSAAVSGVGTPPTATPTSSTARVETPRATTTTATATPSATPAAVVGSVQTDTATTAPKGLNLPILQFLQANFPALQLGDSSKPGIFQVHTLLAHVLQQQQQLQQLQQQAQQQVQKAVASGQPLPTSSMSAGKSSKPAGTSGSSISTPSPPPITAIPSPAQPVKPVQPATTRLNQPAKVVQPAVSTGLTKTPTTSSPSLSTSRPSAKSAKQRSPMPVFAQILPQLTTGGATKITISQGVVGRPSPVVVPKQPKNVAGGFTSPLLLARQKTKVAPPLASVPTPSHSRSLLPPTNASTTTVTLASTPLSTARKEAGSARMSTRTAAKQHHLAKTLVEPVDAEPMDVDVGEPFQILELPPHLKDHSYSRYNPEEGERILKQQAQNIRVFSGIPPARVSYAPPLPDSPNTLYKLLKVLPKKNSSRKSSTASLKTPSKKSSRRYVYL